MAQCPISRIEKLQIPSKKNMQLCTCICTYTYLISDEVNDGRGLPRRDDVPSLAEPVNVAHDLRRGVEHDDDRDAEAVAARETIGG